MIRNANYTDLEILNQWMNHFGNGKLNLEDLNEKPFLYNLVCELNSGLIVGWIQYSIFFENAELNYLYILEEYRNMGYASLLLKEMIQLCRLKKVEHISLEVRKSNIHAIQLYQGYRFKVVNIRKNYYPYEDGLLMVMEVDDFYE